MSLQSLKQLFIIILEISFLIYYHSLSSVNKQQFLPSKDLMKFSERAPPIYFHFNPLGMITRMLWRCGMKRIAAGRKEREVTTCMPRSRRWFSDDMFRPAFNFAQKLKWYRSVSKRKEFTTRGDWKKKLGRRRRPAGARQNLNPFNQLPHFPGVYNSWEAAPAASSENCAVKKHLDPSNPTHARARARAWISMEKG